MLTEGRGGSPTLAWEDSIARDDPVSRTFPQGNLVSIAPDVLISMSHGGINPEVLVFTWIFLRGARKGLRPPLQQNDELEKTNNNSIDFVLRGHSPQPPSQYRSF